MNLENSCEYSSLSNTSSYIKGMQIFCIVQSKGMIETNFVTVHMKILTWGNNKFWHFVKS